MLIKIHHGTLHVIVRNDPSLRSLIKTAEVLLEEGADATMKTRQGLSPFHLAVTKPNLPFLKLLYDFCPNFDVKDFEENNTIEFVLKEKHQDAMRIILCHLHKQ